MNRCTMARASSGTNVPSRMIPRTCSIFKDIVNQHFFRLNGKELDLASQEGADKVVEFLDMIKKNNQGGHKQGGSKPQGDKDRGRRGAGN